MKNIMRIPTKEKTENKFVYYQPNSHRHPEFMIDKSVCVIVLIYNGQQYIKDCFSSLLKINYPRNNCKILAVDNDSSDNSILFIERNFPSVAVIRNKKNYGFAKGNNIGIKWAIEKGFDYIYLLNHDTVVDRNFLGAAIGLAESDQKIGAVQSRIMLYNNKNLINTIGNQVYYLGLGFCGGYKEVYQKDKSYNQEIPYPSGAGVLLKTALLKKITAAEP
ncbi:MAG: glycosyltransferase, partial [Candidatus Berkelbacteria bacterium]|nr:glycosyltransferase [Candidatus Berkelbacteria bacterium]